MLEDEGLRVEVIGNKDAEGNPGEICFRTRLGKMGMRVPLTLPLLG
jgi:hypothetical protein